MKIIKKLSIYVSLIIIAIILMSSNIFAASVESKVYTMEPNYVQKIELGTSSVNNDANSENNDENKVEDLDPNSYITMPSMILNGTGTIKISDRVTTDYDLYYQVIQISDIDFEQLETLLNEYKEYVDKSNTELKQLLEEVNKIKDDYETAVEEVPDAEETKELQELYNTKVEEYNTKVEEYNTRCNEYMNDYNTLKPDYDDAKWIKTEDGKVDCTNAGIKPNEDNVAHFIIWAKLTVGEENYYKDLVYSTEWKTDDGNDDTNNVNNNASNGTNVSNNGVNNNSINIVDNTVANKDLPKTGQASMIIVLAIVVISAIIAYIRYKKLNDVK